MTSNDPILHHPHAGSVPWLPAISDLPYVYQSLDDLPLNASTLEAWDRVALAQALPDSMSGGSAWQRSALECSYRHAAPIVFRQVADSQISFSLTFEGNAFKLGALEGHWKFGCPMLGPGAADLLQGALVQLKKRLPDLPIIVELPGLSQGHHPMNLAKRFGPISGQASYQNAAASLENGVNGWLSRRSTGFRRSIKKSMRRAFENGIEFERCKPGNGDEAKIAYRRMVDIERASWKGEFRTGLFDAYAFYDLLLQRYCERSQARIVFARRQGRDIGFCFGGLAHEVYRGQQTSYLKSESKYSVGNLMHYETVRWLSDEKARLHHFGPIQKGMEYKLRFCELYQTSLVLRFRY